MQIDTTNMADSGLSIMTIEAVYDHRGGGSGIRWRMDVRGPGRS